MADDLLRAFEAVRMCSESVDAEDDGWIDQILDKPRSTKRAKQKAADLRGEIEESILNPTASFSAEWLNRLQQ